MEKCLRQATPDALRQILSDFHSERVALLSTHDFLFAVDKVQSLNRVYPNAFVSSKNLNESRSSLWELIRTLLAVQSPTISIIISSTGLSLSSVQEATTSGFGGFRKIIDESQKFCVIYDFGGLYDKSEVWEYMQQYLPQAFLLSETGNLLQWQVEIYLYGRWVVCALLYVTIISLL